MTTHPIGAFSTRPVFTPEQRAEAATGLYERSLPPRKPTLAVLTEAIGELNRTPWTETDEQMAFELERILRRRGLKLVTAIDALSRNAGEGV